MSENNTPDTTESDAVGKGRPTPKRKEQEAARRRPVIPDSKAARKEQRDKVRLQREKEYQAMREGDERHMPAEHRGPERRFLRDWVDARTSIGEFLLPLSIVFVIASLAVPAASNLGFVVIAVFYVMVFAVAIDTWLMMRRMKKHYVKKFGENRLPRGWSFYVIARHLNIRRFRAPKPKVARGEYPV